MIAEIVSSSRDLFGSDRAAVRLAKVLRNLGAKPTLVLPERRQERGLTDLALNAGIPVITQRVAVVSSRGLHDPGALFFANRGHSVDLIIFNTSAVVSSESTASRRVLVLREWLRPGSARHRLLANFQSHRVDAVAGISSGVLRQWKSIVGSKLPLSQVPDWLDDDWLSPPISKQRSGVLFVGRFNQWKGVFTLADAYERAFASNEAKPQLTFLGAEFDNPAFASYALRLQRRARNHDWIVHPFASDPKKFLANASLLVVPSIRPEPFGMVILEGLAAGCQVIAFSGGPDDMAEHFRHSLSIVDRSTQDLANAISQWWSKGGLPQTADEHQRTMNSLARHYSPANAERSWSTILNAYTSGRGC